VLQHRGAADVKELTAATMPAAFTSNLQLQHALHFARFAEQHQRDNNTEECTDKLTPRSSV
jgi:hypothetical protein